jgi:non-ribosomal peptide synthetase component F
MQNTHNIQLNPATYLQQQYWLNQKMHPATSAYNIAYIWSIQGNLNIDSFIKASKDIVQAFEVFRTKYVFENQVLYQEIHTSVNFEPEILDFSSNNEEFYTDNIQNKSISDFLERPFNLRNDLPIRILLVKISHEKYYLSVAIHHIATDLITWNIFSNTLTRLYKHYAFGKEINIEVHNNYKDYSQIYAQFIETADFNKKLEFWKSYLKDIPNLTDFPIDKKRPKVFTNEGRRSFFTLSEDATNKLRSLSDNEYIILYSYLLSAYAMLIHKYSKQKKFAIGIPFSNRKDSNTTNTTGCFVNILPIIIDLENDITFEKLCSGIQKNMIQVSRNQEIPFLQIINNLNLQFDPQQNPIFQVGFTYEPIIRIDLEELNVHTHAVIPSRKGCKLDQFMHIREVDNKIQGYIEYCTSLFEKETIERITANFTWILSTISSIIDTPVSKINVVCPSERQNLLVDWNNTKAEYESNKSIQQAFEHKALKTHIAFDISVLELFWPLFYDAKLGILASNSEKYPNQIIQTVSNINFTFMQFVPSMLNVFLEFVNEKTLHKLASLKYVSTIGEALSPETVNKFNRSIYKTNKTRLINTYGPTETTVEVSYFECKSEQTIEVVPIGKPIDNTGFYFVDEQFNIQPVGVSGELLIAGDGMASGYFKRPQLTTEKFIENPFNKNLSKIVYRTGDLARYLPDGNIEFLGRMSTPDSIAAPQVSLVKPLSETESVILDIWKETLNLSTISTNDNFFNIGGNSILLIQVANKVQNKIHH